MSLRDYNPFTNLELRLPLAYQEQVRRYSRTRDTSGGGSGLLTSPFSRYVDIWMTAICVGTALEVQVDVPTTVDTWRFEYGSRLQGETAWIELLQLTAIATYEDPLIVSDSRKTIDLANALAAAGTPQVIDALETGQEQPLWGLVMQLLTLTEETLPNLEDESL